MAPMPLASDAQSSDWLDNKLHDPGLTGAQAICTGVWIAKNVLCAIH